MRHATRLYTPNKLAHARSSQRAQPPLCRRPSFPARLPWRLGLRVFAGPEQQNLLAKAATHAGRSACPLVYCRRPLVPWCSASDPRRCCHERPKCELASQVDRPAACQLPVAVSLGERVPASFVATNIRPPHAKQTFGICSMLFCLHGNLHSRSRRSRGRRRRSGRRRGCRRTCDRNSYSVSSLPWPALPAAAPLRTLLVTGQGPLEPAAGPSAARPSSCQPGAPPLPSSSPSPAAPSPRRPPTSPPLGPSTP
mmetsp:Transcript_13888/g.32408  ORF Transcript_13888/g.32408 Transcript_13888/m.32408 type:complete len:253 (-) Transcript_13888:207-965(-)